MDDKCLLLLTTTAESAAAWRRKRPPDTDHLQVAIYQPETSANLYEQYDVILLYVDEDRISDQTLLLCRRLCQEVDRPLLLLGRDQDEAQLIAAYVEGISGYIQLPVGWPLMLAQAQAWLRYAHG